VGRPRRPPDGWAASLNEPRTHPIDRPNIALNATISVPARLLAKPRPRRVRGAPAARSGRRTNGRGGAPATLGDVSPSTLRARCCLTSCAGIVDSRRDRLGGERFAAPSGATISSPPEPGRDRGRARARSGLAGPRPVSPRPCAVEVCRTDRARRRSDPEKPPRRPVERAARGSSHAVDRAIVRGWTLTDG
jgi:hypothetical protein